MKYLDDCSVCPVSILAISLSLATATTTSADPAKCTDQAFSVDAYDAQMTEQLCTMATDIRGQLEECGLAQSRPLTIEMVEDVSHPMANCLAYFDCEYDLVRITDPAAYESLMEEDSSYAALPAVVTLRALLTHEITHALVAHTAGDRSVPLVDQEYVAAAMELELMGEDWREVLIAANPVTLPPKEGLIDIWIYGFAPRKFAVNAWQHFSLPQNGCALVRRIVDGQKSFKKEVR